MTQAKIYIEIGALPQLHELRTVYLLAKLSNSDIRFIAPSRKQGVHTPDIEWLGVQWEIKSPTGSGNDLIHNTLHKAAKQSNNIIIDLRRMKSGELRAIKAILKELVTFKKIKRLKIITKSSEIIDIR